MALLLPVAAAIVHAQLVTNAMVPVTVDNFARAESDLYMGNLLKVGALGRFAHHREPADIGHQIIIRLNRDTLYSSAVFDFDAGPVTVILPDAGKRFMSMQVIDEDHYTHGVFYGAGKHTITRKEIGTRYVAVLARTLVDPIKPDDIQQAHALQDAIQSTQPGGPGKFEVPNWDPVSQKKIRDALLTLAASTSAFRHAFGSKEQVDPVYHLLGTAAGWGGNPDKDATYIGVVPANNDGQTVYKLIINDVPVDGFWSISVYNVKGYFEPNLQNAYSINNLTAKRNTDGAVVIQFGGSGNDPAVNYLPITPGWNYTVRLYRPRKEILDGSWKFPEAQPVN